MTCFIVILRCAMDDLIVEVLDNLAGARVVAAVVASDPEPFLTVANRLYGLAAREVLHVSIVTIKNGLPVRVEHTAELEADYTDRPPVAAN